VTRNLIETTEDGIKITNENNPNDWIKLTSRGVEAPKGFFSKNELKPSQERIYKSINKESNEMMLNIPDWNKYKYEICNHLDTQIKAKFVNEWYKDTEDGVIFSKDTWDRIGNKDRYEVVKIDESIIEVKYKRRSEY
jgi:hypothetical protein